LAINEGRDPELKQFDAKLNIDQLTDTLTSLRLAYKEARNTAYKAYYLLKDQSDFNIEMMEQFEDIFYLSPNEPEFVAYDLIVQLENERNYLDIHQRIAGLANEILASKEVKFAVKVISAVKENNYIQYFKLLEQADYLTACMMSSLIKTIRERAIKSMQRSQARSNIESISVNKFYELLSFEDQKEVQDFCRLYGLEESPEEFEMDDRIGGDGPSFKLRKIKIDGDESKAEARKKFLALKPLMNTRIIEAKRDIENFKGKYQPEKNIHFDNTQVSRKFLVKGLWKTVDSKYYLKVLKHMLNLPMDALQGAPLSAKKIGKKEEPEVIETIIKKPSIAEDQSILSTFIKPLEKQPSIKDAHKPEDVSPLLSLARKESIGSKEALLKAKEIEDKKSKTVEVAKSENLLAAEKRKEQELAKKKEEEERLKILQLKEIEKKLQAKRNASTNEIFEILNQALNKNQKELMGYFEAALDYERDLRHFSKSVLANKFEYRLNTPKLQYKGQGKEVTFMEEEDPYAFFNLLADTLAEKEPSLQKYCYKTVIFHPLYKDIHFELFNHIVKFLTNDQEKLETIEFDQFPALYENKNIEFTFENEIRKLWLSYKIYDENCKSQAKNHDIDEDMSISSAEAPDEVSVNEILSANMILFIITGNKKQDQERFEPICSAICGRQSSENLSIIFLQLYEIRHDKPQKKLKKAEIARILDLGRLNGKNVKPYFLKVGYSISQDNEEGEQKRFYLKDIDYILKTKASSIMVQGIEDQIFIKLPAFYTLKDLTEKLRNSFEDLDNLEIDYESTGTEVKAKLFHELMSSNSIESYFYVKNFLSHAVDSIKINFDFWYSNLDRVAPEFLENYNQKALDKIKSSKADFDKMLERMLKINDFDENYNEILKAGTKARLGFNTVYDLIERKLRKVFQTRKKEIRLNEVSHILEKEFKFNSAIGIDIKNLANKFRY